MLFALINVVVMRLSGLQAGKLKKSMEDAERRRKQNQLRHLPPDKQKPKSERRRKLLAEVE
jgi:hypothetical protein